MASRADEGEGGIKHKNGGAGADKRNRRALCDIGNLAALRGPDGKPLAQVSRPVTRSFCAQLLANAQAAAAAENNKAKPNAAKVDGGAIAAEEFQKLKVCAGKEIARKEVAIAKPARGNVIEISPDTEKAAEKEEHSVNMKKLGEATKKKSRTLTSVLTARSKAVCGVADKPREAQGIDDIDLGDKDNELAMVEYIDDMYNFYREAEREARISDYMESQLEINEKMRGILVDWLIEVHYKFELTKETLYLTINIIDRFLAATTVPRRELQLLGIGAMLTASKYEEIWAPEVNDFVCISDRAYNRQQILTMEKAILGKLEWTLTVPTPYVFLARFIKASLSDQEMENMVHFLAELGMVQYATTRFCPSMIAASAVYAARCTLDKSPAWSETLKRITGFSEHDLMNCGRLLVEFHSMAAENKLRVVYRKYSNPERKAVALLPPAKTLLVHTTQH